MTYHPYVFPAHALLTIQSLVNVDVAFARNVQQTRLPTRSSCRVYCVLTSADPTVYSGYVLYNALTEASVDGADQELIGKVRGTHP